MNSTVNAPMQVTFDPQHFRRVATWMNLLFVGQRYRGVTRVGLAKQHKAQGCNVSAYTSSRGTTLNISREKIIGILLDLGLHPDGVLAPGLHRWQFPADMAADMRDALGDLLSLNPPLDATRPPRCITWKNSKVGFLLHRPARVAAVLASMPMQQLKRLRDREGLGIVSETVSLGEASELQTLLGASDPAWVVERSIDSYLSPQVTTNIVPLPQTAAGR